jgi:beta-N-acetylhexosaminidase
MRSPRSTFVVRILATSALLVSSLSTSALLAAGLPSVPATSAAWVDQTLSAMSTRQKVGQLFVPRVYGTTADAADPVSVAKNMASLGVANAQDLITTYAVGGLVYFGANVTTPQALARMGNGIQQAASSNEVPVPVLTAIDQEQGLVVRVGPPATVLPGSMALGAGRSQVDALVAARITARELRAMGVFADYAPVADVNSNPANPVIGVRSFSADPVLTGQLVASQVLGFQGAGVSATAKHFPGHGDTGTDSHWDLPIITHDRSTLDSVDLLPFRAAIMAGVDSIMTAHIVVPSLDDSGDPATLSAPIITGLLRGRLGFDGVVITDSLQMAGVRTKYGDGEVAVRAILAGADQLLDPPDLAKSFKAVLSAVKSGRISGKRLDESVRRILALKAKRGLMSTSDARVDVSKVDAIVGSPQHRDLALAITDRTTTLVKGSRALPIGARQGMRILVTGCSDTATASLGKSLRSRGARVRVIESGREPRAFDVDSILRAAASVDYVIALTEDAYGSRPQPGLIDSLRRSLRGSGTPLIVVATGTPYDIAAFPRVKTYLATYSYRPVAMEALARVLVGEVPAVGRLPVAIPKQGGGVLYPLGWRADR